MKLREYLLFAAMLVPTAVVVAAAVYSLATIDPAPEYRQLAVTASSHGLYPGDMTTDE